MTYLSRVCVCILLFFFAKFIGRLCFFLCVHWEDFHRCWNVSIDLIYDVCEYWWQQLEGRKSVWSIRSIVISMWSFFYFFSSCHSYRDLRSEKVSSVMFFFFLHSRLSKHTYDGNRKKERKKEETYFFFFLSRVFLFFSPFHSLTRFFLIDFFVCVLLSFLTPVLVVVYGVIDDNNNNIEKRRRRVWNPFWKCSSSDRYSCSFKCFDLFLVSEYEISDSFGKHMRI